MMLNEQTTVPDSALPLPAMKEHLHIGTGFTDDGAQDALLVAHLRAALAAIEGRTGKALLERRFLLRLNNFWQRRRGLALPLSPVARVISLTLYDRAGQATVIEAERYHLVPDMQRPRIQGNGALLPNPAEGGAIEVVFDAGFGANWGDVPADLAQAVLLLTAEFYEVRHDGGQSVQALPKRIQSLIERWRTVRVLGGGGV